MSSSRDHRRQLYEQLVGQPVAKGRFVITKLLGFGGMGAVYEAVQQNMDRKVALKLIPTHDPTIVARFEREALTISKLQHPNTITVFDFGQSEDGFLFLSMELLEGRTLTEEIEAGPLSAERVVHIGSQMARSLAEAHRAGIVHRDVKPDNIILITVDDDPDVVKVLDFGIAKAVMGEDDVQLTGDGRIIGTPRYMSPEQILAEPLDHRSDIYSLGCILFELLCGAPPFQQSSTTALMISHTQDPPPPFAQQLDPGMLSRIPAGLETVVRRALAKSPDDRPADCDQLREELERALRNTPPPALDVSQPNMQPAHDAQKASVSPDATAISPDEQSVAAKLLIGGIGFLLVLIIGMVALTVFSSDGPDSTVATNDVEGASVTTAQAPATNTGEMAVIDRPPAERPEEPKRGFVTIHIESEPSEARVFEGKGFIGITPIDIPVKAEVKKHNYRIVKDGYEELNVSIHVVPEKEVHTKTYRLEELEKKSPIRKKRKNPPSTVSNKTKEPAKNTANSAPNVEILPDEPTANVERLN